MSTSLYRTEPVWRIAW